MTELTMLNRNRMNLGKSICIRYVSDIITNNCIGDIDLIDFLNPGFIYTEKYQELKTIMEDIND